MIKQKPTSQQVRTPFPSSPLDIGRASNTLLEVSHDQIARRAYELFLARGGDHGHDHEDWIQAEAELRQLYRY